MYTHSSQEVMGENNIKLNLKKVEGRSKKDKNRN